MPIGTVPGQVALNLRVTETLVHGWDLARATGQPADLPADLAGQALAFPRDYLPSVPPGRTPSGAPHPGPERRTPSGAPQPVSDDVPAADRLAVALGRRVDA